MTKMELAYEILARDKGASRTFDRVGDSADRAGRKGEKFGSILSKGLAGGAVAAAAGVAGLGFALSGFVKDAQEAAKIGRLTDAVIKSTGGVANVSSEQVAKLSEAISNKVAIDDEAIQSGANLLLTFTKVRNEVGKGNDIFDQATQAAVDMSVALGTDITSASLQLGKALNDPIKGVTALSKAGVSFTQQQKDQIKAMVEAGDVLGAQKVILAEMQTQFGGAAEAAADPIERLKVVAGNLGESIGTALLPYVEDLATYLVEEGVPAFERFAAWVGENRVQIEEFGRGAAAVFLEITAAVFRVGEGFARGFAIAIDAMNKTAQGAFSMAGLVLAAFEQSLGWLPGYKDKFNQANALLDAFAFGVDQKASQASADLRGFADTAGAAAQKVEDLKDRINQIQSKSVSVKLSIDSSALLRGAQTIAQLDRQGDGPGRGGPMLARVSKLIAGTGMRVTSTYRTPARNRAVGGSPNSYHLSASNPAVDVVGPPAQLDRLAAQLRGAGGLRELLWRTAGHYDHLHVAHSGGPVLPSWARMPGDGPDERTARLQVGERVQSRAEVAAGGGGTAVPIVINLDGRVLAQTVAEVNMRNGRR